MRRSFSIGRFLYVCMCVSVLIHNFFVHFDSPHIQNFSVLFFSLLILRLHHITLASPPRTPNTAIPFD